MPSDVEVVFPACNEAGRLRESNILASFHDVFSGVLGDRFRIHVVVNGCSDDTFELVSAWAEGRGNVVCSCIEEKGKGAAFLYALERMEAPTFAFVDIDGAVEASQAAKLLPYLEGSDLVVGSRVCRGARILVPAPLKRRVNSVLARVFTKMFLGLPVLDPFCGCKAFRTASVRPLLPSLACKGAMIDADVLLAARRRGLRIKEVGIDWRHVPGSNISSLLKADARNLKAVFRLRFGPCTQ